MTIRAKSAFSSLYEEYQPRLDKVSSSRGKESLRRNISDFVGFIGFEHFIYASFIPSERGHSKDDLVIINGYPQEWRERYDHKGYSSVDPVVLSCRRNVMPLNWSNIAPGKFEGGQREQDMSVMDEAKEFGLSYGWTVPLHNAGGGWNLFSIASSSYDNFFMHDHDPRLALAYLILPVINKVITETSVERLEKQSRANSVTKREREVIAWAADGKTNWETSLIMGISESTVRFHLKNVTRKMGAANTVNTVSKAILYGII